MLTVSRPGSMALARRAPASGDGGVADPEFPRLGARRWDAIQVLALLLPLLLHLAGALWIALSVPFPSPIDELQHLSFVRAMKAEPALFPDHAALKVLRPDATGFSPQANYLNHPSPYYLALATIDAPGRSAAANVRTLRLVNVALSTAALALALLAGFALLSDAASRLLFGLTLALFPKTSVVAGMINNDNLGLLAAAAVFAGLASLLRHDGAKGPILAGLGLALAGWTKLTLLVMLGIAAVLAVLLALLRPSRPSPRNIALLGLIAAAGAVPTLANLVLYGRILYVRPTHNAVPSSDRPELSFGEHFLLFLRQLAAKWPGLEPAGPAQLLALGIVLAVAAAIVWRFLADISAGRATRAADALAAAFLLALPASLIIHAIYGYGAFRAIGDLTSAQTRYYGALWPGFALGAARLFAAMPAGRTRTLAAAFLVALLLLSSAFFASAVA